MTHTIFKSIKLINPATNMNQKVNVVLQNEKIIRISKDLNLEKFNQNNQTVEETNIQVIDDEKNVINASFPVFKQIICIQIKISWINSK